MIVEQNFEEFVRLLNEFKVRYLIVGAYAVGFHAEPRNTGDLDIWIEPVEENADKMMNVLQAFGMEGLTITVEDFLSPEVVIQLGVPPVRIDILTTLSGLSFPEAYQARLTGKFGSTTMEFISLDDLIKNKEATGRARDIADVELLKNYRSK